MTSTLSDKSEMASKIINNVAAVTVKLSAAIGLVLTAAYCYFEIHFFPGGLTLSDSFLYVALSMGFGFVLLVFCGYSTLSLVWLVSPLMLPRRRLLRLVAFNSGLVISVFVSLFCWAALWQSYPVVPIVTVIFLVALFYCFYHRSRLIKSTLRIWGGPYFGSVFAFVVIVFYLCVSVLNSESGKSVFLFELFGAVLVSGVCGALGFSMLFSRRRTVPKNTNGKYVPLILLSMSILAPVLFFTVIERMLLNVFESMGIRQTGVSVVLNKENADRLISVIPLVANSLSACHQEKDSPTVVHGVNILWYGMGDKVLVELTENSVSPAFIYAPVAKLRIELDSKGVTPIKNAPQEMCIALPETLFEPASSSLTDGAKGKFLKAWNSARQGRFISSINISGHADIRPISGGNGALSLKRAQAVEDILVGSECINNELIETKGEGSNKPKVTCDKNLASDELNDCLSPNRRVEVRAIFD